jgi:hypothetical protein
MMISVKKIISAVSIAGALGFTGLAVGPAVANADPGLPGIPWAQDHDGWGWGHGGHGHWGGGDWGDDGWGDGWGGGWGGPVGGCLNAGVVFGCI